MFAATRERFNQQPLVEQLVIVLALLNLADFFMTSRLIAEFGFVIEANPVMYELLVWTDTVWSLLVVKASALAILWFGIKKLEASHKFITVPRLEKILLFSIFLYCCIVTWSLYLCIVQLILPKF